MKHYSLNIKAILIAFVFSLIVISIALYIDNSYKDWSKEVIQTNKVLCEVVAKQLQSSSESVIDSLYYEDYFSEGYKTTANSNAVDAILTKISQKNFNSAEGIEGGFFTLALDEFQGYSYPTSPPPIPVYGPPPRSYNIIKKQVIRTIEKDTSIVMLHQFDPAIFPLVTLPVKANNEIVGAIWVRTHIERELPQLKINDILNIAAVISLLGFIVAVFFSIRMKMNLEKLSSNLEVFEKDYSHRIKPQSGMFGFIGNSINKMLDALQAEHVKREKLELELHQQDKMASLGKLIAGVAHEVKTPLAIIKTRIQMWQQKLKDKEKFSEKSGEVTQDSMQMVINEVDRMNKLVNKLLIFSKPVTDDFIPIDLNELINDILALFRTKRFASRAIISFEENDGLPMINGNPDKIQQVFLNIITNAFESINREGKISIQISLEEGFVKTTVTDNGSGIPEEVVDNIFDPFFTTKQSGTGLGLSIAYEIVQAHKGRIEVNTREGEGTRIIVYLPIQQKEVTYDES